MTWRRFTTLLRGLGPQSATVAHAQVRRAMGRSKESRVNTITTPEAADRAFVALFGAPVEATKKH